MTGKVVIVAGAGVAEAAGTSALHGLDESLLRNPAYAHIMDPCRYGDHLPELWEFAREKAISAAETEPTAIHKGVASRTDWAVVSENVGEMFTRCGAREVVPLYGSVFAGRCLRCQNRERMPLARYMRLGAGEIPECGRCGKRRMRPDLRLPGEHARNKRVAERMFRDATSVIYLGVRERSEPVASWHRKVPWSVLVSETPWGEFGRHIQASPLEWATVHGFRY